MQQLDLGTSAAANATARTVNLVRGGSESGIVSTSVSAAGDSAFNMSFVTTRPGTLHFLVVYSSLMGRYSDALVAWDNTPTDPVTLMTTDLSGFTGGVVARGSCSNVQGGVATVCRIGPNPGASDTGASSCSASVTCQVENTCFGALCDYSLYGMAPNATYKVWA